MKKDVKAILNYKDSCDMYVINSYRKKKQYALSFDGVDDYVFLPVTISGEMTIEAKVSKINQTDLRASYVESGDTIDNALFYSSAGDYLGVFSNQGDVQNRTVFIGDTGFRNICFVSDGLGSNKLFVDGTELSLFLNDSITLQFNNMTLAGNKFYFMKGFFSDFRVWNYQRTQQEIQNNLNKKLTGNEPGLVAYYDFLAGSGTTLFDKTANGNPGTIYGATWVEI